MYAQLTIVAGFDRDRVSEKLIEQIGNNRVDLDIGLQGTPFELDPSIHERIIATEVIRNSASLVYFFEGSDTVSVHITAANVGLLKAQAVRVTRQAMPHFNWWRRVSASVAIFIQERSGSDDLIIEGKYQRKLKRITEALSDKWIGKLLPSVITYVTTYLYANASAATSALIALIAAGITFAVDAFVAARSAEKWKWKDAT